MVLRTVGLALVLLYALPARAEPTQDVEGWTQRFTQAALKQDNGAMLGLVRDIADARFNVEAIRPTLQSVGSMLGAQQAQYAEQFGEKDVASFLKRINVAVRYERGFLFYSVVLARSTGGWELIQFNVDGNVNKILDAPWPS